MFLILAQQAIFFPPPPPPLRTSKCVTDAGRNRGRRRLVAGQLSSYSKVNSVDPGDWKDGTQGEPATWGCDPENVDVLARVLEPEVTGVIDKGRHEALLSRKAKFQLANSTLPNWSTSLIIPLSTITTGRGTQFHKNNLIAQHC